MKYLTITILTITLPLDFFNYIVGPENLFAETGALVNGAQDAFTSNKLPGVSDVTTELRIVLKYQKFKNWPAGAVVVSTIQVSLCLVHFGEATNPWQERVEFVLVQRLILETTK